MGDLWVDPVPSTTVLPVPIWPDHCHATNVCRSGRCAVISESLSNQTPLPSYIPQPGQPYHAHKNVTKEHLHIWRADNVSLPKINMKLGTLSLVAAVNISIEIVNRIPSIGLCSKNLNILNLGKDCNLATSVIIVTFQRFRFSFALSRSFR